VYTRTMIIDSPQIHSHELDADPESEYITPYMCPVCKYDWAVRQPDGNWTEA
jgi:hypothetical protein